MSDFKPGDVVLMDDSQVGKLISFDRENNRFVIELRVGGGTDRLTDHISLRRFRHIGDVSGEDVQDREPDAHRDAVHNTEAATTDTGAPLTAGGSGTRSKAADDSGSGAVQAGDVIHTLGD